MIRKYTFGNPLDTGAVIQNVPEVSSLNEFSKTETEKEVIFSCKLNEKDKIYGLGETVRGINKRGWIYESYATDDGIHTETKKSLYCAHNFFLIGSDKPFGVFADAPFKVIFDFGYTKSDELNMTFCGKDFKLYIIEGNTPMEIIKSFRKAIGQSYLAPFWSFGFMQSRWGYKNAEDIRRVAGAFRRNAVPLDAVFLDLDYMDGCRVFTTNEKDFPNFPSLVREMKEENIRLVPIVDAAVKKEEGYFVSDEGTAGNYFCKYEDGADYIGCVWPGLTYFPDFLNKDTRNWFGAKYKIYTDMGIEGFWNDMNEPSIFYSQKKLMEFLDAAEELRKKDGDVDSWEFFKLREDVNTLWDYKEFYHNADGKKLRHDRVHNLYGFNMTKCAAEGLEKIQPGKRFLLFSRSSYIGMHRYAGIWTGDNQSWWSHILLELQQLPSLNMCGFLYIGSDIGGFNSNATEDLVLRWFALAVFVPLMRNHNGSDRDQECFSFQHLNWFKKLIQVRYRLLPYLYSEYLKAVYNADMMFKPLAFLFSDDEIACETEDQLMLGSDLMIAPVYRQNTQGRTVYLPEDMLMILLSGDQYTCTPMKQGLHYVNVPMHSVPMFLRKGSILPLADIAEHTGGVNQNKLSLICCTEQGHAFYELYRDDGVSKTESLEKIEINNKNNTAECSDKEIKLLLLSSE